MRMEEGVLEATPAENEARAFIHYLEFCIEGSLSPGVANVTPSDKEDLEWAFSALPASFDELANCFLNPVREQNPALYKHGYSLLWRLMGAAFVAGSRADHERLARSFASRVNALKSPQTSEKD